MSSSNANRCIARTIDKYEGGYDDDRRDRGNWTSGKIGEGQLKGTKYGIAAHVYPNVDIPNLTMQDAINIYKRDYWPKVAGDILPDGVDMTAYDCCVNSGASRALKCLAKAFNTANTNSVALAKAANSATDKIDVIKKANEARRSFLIGLNNATYQKGWLRRVADVEAISIQWWMEFTKAPPKAIKEQLQKEAIAADKKVIANKAGTTATGTGSAATAGHATQQGFDWVIVGEVGLVLILVIATAYFIYQYRNNHQRAKALRETAAAIGE